MIKTKQLKDLIVECLVELEKAIPAIVCNKSAVNLLLGTAAQESLLGTYIRQVGGPALGIYQMEPATHMDLWANWINYREFVYRGLMKLGPEFERPTNNRLVYDLRYATVMARLHYYRRPEPLPEGDDVHGLALYWKDHYNTSLGAGSVHEFEQNYKTRVA